MSPHLIYVLPFSLSGKLKIDAIDSLGRNLSSISLKEFGKSGFSDLCSFETDPKGDFYLFFKFKDVAAKIHSDASAAWQKQFYNGRKGGTKKILWIDVPKTLFFLDAAFDTRSNLFVLMGHLARNPNQDIAVLDREGSKIAELTLPNMSHTIYIDQNNYLYTRAQKGTVLKKYQIKYAN